ncbi:diguanylate cyclase [bacterium]|nr:diguanylate cyclase [bacterium]
MGVVIQQENSITNEKTEISISQQWGTLRLRLLFLVPMAIAIVTIIVVLGIMLYKQTHQDIHEGVIRIRGSVETFYEESVQYDAHALRAIINTLSQDKRLYAALAQKDRKALLNLVQPLYKEINHDFKITHLYFTGEDRVNLLRVHSPLRYGDVIGRLTTLQAEKSGTIAYGVELGPLGTFTLRLVSPWFDPETNKLIGYVELGMEIDQVIKKLQKFFNVQVYTVINKKFLNREKWEAGMRSLGRKPIWDRFEHLVTSEQSMKQIPPVLEKYLKQIKIMPSNKLIDLPYKGTSYHLCFLPLQDAGGRNIAQMVMLSNVSEEENVARKTVYFGSITAFIVGSVLFVFFYWLVGQIGKRIEKNEKELRELATHDGLTGLYNHRFFYTLLENEVKRADRYKYSTSLLLLDIDHFKAVNDTYGHQAGDTILRDLSKRLSNRMRSSDWICRYGGEEMTVILPETDLSAAKDIAESLRILVEKKPFKINDDHQSITINVSIGVSAYPEHSKDVSVLVSKADTALYKAKESGRNRICVYG